MEFSGNASMTDSALRAFGESFSGPEYSQRFIDEALRSE